jgi:hypothetical protein
MSVLLVSSKNTVVYKTMRREQKLDFSTVEEWGKEQLLKITNVSTSIMLMDSSPGFHQTEHCV